MHRLPYSEAAQLLGLTSDAVRRRAQNGTLEPGQPIDGAQTVTYRSIAVLAAQMDVSIADMPDDLGPIADLREALTAFHILGCERAAFLRSLHADAMAAEHTGDLKSACVYWQLAAGLQNATYHWDAAAQTWITTIPGIAEGASRSPASAPIAGDAS